MDDATRQVPAESPSVSRPEVATARRIVVKVGTRVLTRDDGQIALARLFSIVEAVVHLKSRGREVLLVSSGAVGLGAGALGLSQIPTELADRQACAAVGQTRLVGLYQEGLAHLGLICGQVAPHPGGLRRPGAVSQPARHAAQDAGAGYPADHQRE